MTVLTSAEQLGPIIREARKTAGMSQRELADRCAVNNSYISYIERGARNASVIVLIAALAELGLSLRVVKQ